MIINQSAKLSSFIPAAALSIGLAFGTHASADISYLIDINTRTATDLNTRIATELGSGSVGTATAINDTGQVVGYFHTSPDQYFPFHIFITGPNGVSMTDLGTLGSYDSKPTGINAVGQVVGWYTEADYSSHSFITGPNGADMRELDTRPGTFLSTADAINAAGQAVGYSLRALPGGEDNGSVFISNAFITGPNGVGVTDLGSLGDADSLFSFSSARGINAAGQVVGHSSTTGSQQRAFITGPDGVGMTDLGTLGGESSWASGINDAGQVVGASDTTSGNQHAFITGPNGFGMTDLGTLAENDSFAFGINDAGQVVGQFQIPAGDYHAFITGPDGVGMTDLNSLVHLPEGVVLTQAVDINNAGQVIAIGSSVAPVPVIPEPEIYAMLMAGLGLVGFMARRKKLRSKTSPGNEQLCSP